MNLQLSKQSPPSRTERLYPAEAVFVLVAAVLNVTPLTVQIGDRINAVSISIALERFNKIELRSFGKFLYRLNYLQPTKFKFGTGTPDQARIHPPIVDRAIS